MFVLLAFSTANCDCDAETDLVRRQSGEKINFARKRLIKETSRTIPVCQSITNQCRLANNFCRVVTNLCRFVTNLCRFVTNLCRFVTNLCLLVYKKSQFQPERPSKCPNVQQTALKLDKCRF